MEKHVATILGIALYTEPRNMLITVDHSSVRANSSMYTPVN